MRLKLGPRSKQVIAHFTKAHKVEGEVPLSEAEWRVVLMAIALSFMAQMNHDNECVRECRHIMQEASLRTGLPLRTAIAHEVPGDADGTWEEIPF
jgi:hypothetical protein